MRCQKIYLCTLHISFHLLCIFGPKGYLDTVRCRTSMSVLRVTAVLMPRMPRTGRPFLSRLRTDYGMNRIFYFVPCQLVRFCPSSVAAARRRRSVRTHFYARIQVASVVSVDNCGGDRIMYYYFFYPGKGFDI